jgi:hypothetical protein
MKAPTYYIAKLEKRLRLPKESINAFFVLFFTIYSLSAATNSFLNIPEAVAEIMGVLALICLGVLDPIHQLVSSGRRFISHLHGQETN